MKKRWVVDQGFKSEFQVRGAWGGGAGIGGSEGKETMEY